MDTYYVPLHSERPFKMTVFEAYIRSSNRKPFGFVRQGWLVGWLGAPMGDFPFNDEGLESSWVDDLDEDETLDDDIDE